ncbi:MAG: acyltransferase domain-containing protein [Eubacteriales bacterium]
MDFFIDEILENEEIKALLKSDAKSAEKGREIAGEIVKKHSCVPVEPGMMQLFVLAHLADYALETNGGRGIPREITVATLKDVNIWIGNYMTQYGRPGTAQLGWLCHHYLGDLFRLGRLQFQLGRAGEGVPSGEYVLETHIPQGEPLGNEACLESFRMAGEFFEKYYPGQKAEYCVCCSWLLCPNLVNVAGENSNIVKFMRLWTQLPHGGDDSAQAVQRVFGFGFDREDLANAPEKTSLQRNLKKYLLGGGKLEISAGYRKL